MCVHTPGQGPDGEWLIGLPFRFEGRLWGLVADGDREPETALKLHGVALTHVGRELSAVADIQPVPQYARDLERFFRSHHNVRMVEADGPRNDAGTA